jgi:hypothetical protein
MSVFKRRGVYWYHFLFAGRHIQETTKTASKTLASTMVWQGSAGDRRPMPITRITWLVAA